MNSDRVCRLCLKLILNYTFEPLDRGKSRMLKVLFQEWDDDVIKDAIICTNCVKNIHLSYDFKISCIVNVDHLKTNICNTSKLYLTLDAVDIKNEEEIACQFCLNYFKRNSFIDLSIKQEVPLKVMLEKCLPEIDIKITENTLMCQNCMEYLQVQFDFVISCLDNEEKIRQFCSLEKHKNLIDILECIKNFRLLENSKNNADVKEENTKAEDYRPDDLLHVEKLEVLEVINHEVDVGDDVKIHIKEEENKETVTERNETTLTQISNCQEHHKNKALFSCQFYSDKTHYKGSLKRYIINQLVRNKNKKFHCPECQKCFNQKRVLDNHILSQHDNLCNLVTSKIHSCSSCSYKTANKTHLVNHVNANHSKLKRYQCSYCLHAFVQKSDLNRHISSVHLNTGSFICTGCKKTFNRKHVLDSHIIARHRKNVDLMKTLTNKIYYCDHCTYISISKTLFTKHIKIHDTHEILGDFHDNKTLFSC